MSESGHPDDVLSAQSHADRLSEISDRFAKWCELPEHLCTGDEQSTSVEASRAAYKSTIPFYRALDPVTQSKLNICRKKADVEVSADKLWPDFARSGTDSDLSGLSDGDIATIKETALSELRKQDPFELGRKQTQVRDEWIAAAYPQSVQSLFSPHHKHGRGGMDADRIDEFMGALATRERINDPEEGPYKAVSLWATVSTLHLLRSLLEYEGRSKELSTVMAHMVFLASEPNEGEEMTCDTAFSKLLGDYRGKQTCLACSHPDEGLVHLSEAFSKLRASYVDSVKDLHDDMVSLRSKQEEYISRKVALQELLQNKTKHADYEKSGLTKMSKPGLHYLLKFGRSDDPPPVVFRTRK